ncbi:MAG: DivIVA domain-containing protein [Acidimicrobiia bacterium]
MDISPRELRDTDIKEGFRGYHRDDVDELLERAASTIESLSERVRQMSERVADAQNTSTRSRDAEETLQRTLVLAQRTADEAIADAQKRARKMVDDAEHRAHTLVTEAETTSRRIAEEERRRIEAEVQDLAGRRDKLKSDVDSLERFESEYRQRVRAAIEKELDSLGRATSEDLEPPSLHDVEVPAPPERMAPERMAPERVADDRMAPERVAEERPSRPVPPAPPPRAPEPARPPEPLPPPPEPPRATEPRREDPFEALAAAPENAGEWRGSTAGVGRAEEPAPSGGDGLSAYVADEPIEAEVLDDDAFFASLREAVRDDEAPLVLGEDATSENFFDQDQDEEEEAGSRRRFRRKR